MNMKQKRKWVVMVVAAVVLAASGPARAATIYYDAIGATGLSTAAKTWHSSTYATIDITDDVTGGSFILLGAIFPFGSGINWQARIKYQTPDTTAGVVCSWTVQVSSGQPSAGNPDTMVNGWGGAATSAPWANYVTVVGSALTHTAAWIYRTPQAGFLRPYNTVTSALCTSGAQCEGGYLWVGVSLDTSGTTASQCNFVALELTTN